MKNIGLTLIALSFLVGSYLTVLDAQEVQWSYFLVVLGFGFVGVGMVQVAKRQLAEDLDRIATDIAVIEETLDRVVEKVTMLNTNKADINPYDFGGRIDDLLIDDLNTFVDARKTISHAYGLEAYAQVMTHYAGGERYLNRVWSAGADGYIDEVETYIAKAQEQFTEARDRLQQVKAQ